MTGLLGYFDCRADEPLELERHLGFGPVDPMSGVAPDLGRAAPTPLTDLLDAPYAFVPVEGDVRRELAEHGDRLRDARFLWLDARLELRVGRDGDSPAGSRVKADVVVRSRTGERYEATALPPEHGAVGGLRGYLLLRAAT